LDEPTSALDAHSQRPVPYTLWREAEVPASQLGTHRLSTNRNVQVFCGLIEGDIVEDGHHEGLMQFVVGAYHPLAELKFLREGKRIRRASLLTQIYGRSMQAEQYDERRNEDSAKCY
jgi:hypothetical protein